MHSGSSCPVRPPRRSRRGARTAPRRTTSCSGSHVPGRSVHPGVAAIRRVARRVGDPEGFHLRGSRGRRSVTRGACSPTISSRRAKPCRTSALPCSARWSFDPNSPEAHAQAGVLHYFMIGTSPRRDASSRPALALDLGERHGRPLLPLRAGLRLDRGGSGIQDPRASAAPEPWYARPPAGCGPPTVDAQTERRRASGALPAMRIVTPRMRRTARTCDCCCPAIRSPPAHSPAPSSAHLRPVPTRPHASATWVACSLR